MTKFLLNHPIGVIMVFTAMIIFSFIGFKQLPVSLLPHIEVPSILIKVNYPNGAPAEIEQNVLKIIRQNLIMLNGLKNIESKASSESGVVELTFEYGTSMSLAYIEANEKIDRLIEYLPNSMDRPQVIKINTSDIPILRIHAVPKNVENYLSVSELVTKVIKKRLEQLQGISLVDVNGIHEAVISIIPNEAKLESYGIDQQLISEVISANNQQLGGVSVKDGHYRYYVKIQNDISDINDVALVAPNGCKQYMDKVVTFMQAVEQKEQTKLIFAGYSQKQAKLDFDVSTNSQNIIFVKENLFELRKGSLNPYVLLMDKGKLIIQFEISPSNVDSQLDEINNFIISK